MPMPLLVGTNRVLLGQDAPYTYQYRELFLTARAAPFPGPNVAVAANPGVADWYASGSPAYDGSYVSIASNLMTFLGTTPNALFFVLPLFAVSTGGLAVLYRVPRVAATGFLRVGLNGITYVGIRSTRLDVYNNPGYTVYQDAVNVAPWTVLLLTTPGRSTYFLVRAGNSGPFTLAFTIAEQYASASYAPRMTLAGGSPYDHDLSEVAVLQLPARWRTTNCLATDALATTASGNTITEPAAARITEHTFACATGGTYNLRFARTDDNNCWCLRADQTAQTLKLYQVVGGTETQRATAAVTLTNGVTYTMNVRVLDSIIYLHLRGVSINETQTDQKASYTTGVTAASLATGASVDHAGTNLASTPIFGHYFPNGI